jgi:ATP-dependent helicase Lhr and Lhr-like helicase
MAAAATMTSSTSSSDEKRAYDRLHPKIRAWIRAQGWTSLRPVQAGAINVILDGEGDVLISATTAAGKTEAAFLPILTKIADRRESGLSALYVSPLKALINDQFVRLDRLCEELEVPIVRWHGDASQSTKARFAKEARGIALITPESIEAMFVRHPDRVQTLLSNLDFIVVDEVHAFMQGARGLHLACLMKRIAAASRKPTRRVGLSATIGDLALAASWLRPNAPWQVSILEFPGGLDLMLQIRGYIDKASKCDTKKTLDPVNVTTANSDYERAEAATGAPAHAVAGICNHLFDVLRGSNNLVFGGSRRMVEIIADALRQKSVATGVPNEFFPHHGNLSKEIREDLESRLKAGGLPTTAVCTTTLELGIDIGSVKSVAQIGAPRSISSLRQRLGRTGRRDSERSILRIYVIEPELNERSGFVDGLRQEIVRSVAAIRLLAQKFSEPPTTSAALATGLLHQTLSLIAERGGIRPNVAFNVLSGPGPFAAAQPKDYVELLRHAKSEKIIEQAPDGILMLGSLGERLVQARDFYPLFTVSQEWRLVLASKTLGSIPLSNPVAIDNLILFAGRRWRIVALDETAHVIQVEAHSGGQVPKFETLFGEEAHTRLVREMKVVYEDVDVPEFLDAAAKTLLAEGREAYRRGRLASRKVLEMGDSVLLFPWVGSSTNAALSVALSGQGVKSEDNGVGLTAAAGLDQTINSLSGLAELTPAELENLEHNALGLCTEKYDEFVPTTLLQRFWGRRNECAIRAIPEIARELLASADL